MATFPSRLSLPLYAPERAERRCSLFSIYRVVFSCALLYTAEPQPSSRVPGHAAAAPAAISERSTNSLMEEFRHQCVAILRQATGYDILPSSGKVVVFDHRLPIRHAFMGLVEHGGYSLEWDRDHAKIVAIVFFGGCWFVRFVCSENRWAASGIMMMPINDVRFHDFLYVEYLFAELNLSRDETAIFIEG